jgi:hypothetical protein
MHSDRSGTPHSHQEVHIMPQGIWSDPNGYGSGESTDGVETSRCMDSLVCWLRNSGKSLGRNLASSLQSYEAALLLLLPWSMTNH